MEQLDFSSVMAVIRHYISPDHGMSQGGLLDELFDSLHVESKEPIIFDGASINRWLKGTERVSPIITQYYLKKRNREKLAEDIEQYILRDPSRLFTGTHKEGIAWQVVQSRG